jgi:hypothetical protein
MQDTIERYRRNTRSAQPIQRSDEQNMQVIILLTPPPHTHIFFIVSAFLFIEMVLD